MNAFEKRLAAADRAFRLRSRGMATKEIAAAMDVDEKQARRWIRVGRRRAERSTVRQLIGSES